MKGSIAFINSSPAAIASQQRKKQRSKQNLLNNREKKVQNTNSKKEISRKGIKDYPVSYTKIKDQGKGLERESCLI